MEMHKRELALLQHEVSAHKRRADRDRVDYVRRELVQEDRVLELRKLPCVINIHNTQAGVVNVYSGHVREQDVEVEDDV